MTVILVVIGALGTVTQRNNTGAEGLGNKRTNGNYTNESIFKIDLNTEKSPGNLRRLAVTQTAVRNY